MNRSRKNNYFRKFQIFAGFIGLVIFTNFLGAQDVSRYNQKTESTFSLMGLGESVFPQMPQVESSKMLMASVDEDEYYVDAGDVFIIKVDVKGPAFKIFNSVVTPDGYLILPDARSVYCRHLTLKQATDKIDQALQKGYPQAAVESHLYQVHSVKVNVLGALPRPGKILLSSSDRLFDAVSGMINPFLSDTTALFNFDVISFRNISIERIDKRTHYDLLRFKLMGDRSQNPYLQDDDVIYINFKDSTRYTVTVRGAVARPVEFEYKPGDRLGTAIKFASGLLPIADSSRIELVRFSTSFNSLDKVIMSLPGDSSYLLQADDRIYVREKIRFHKKQAVIVQGEVVYPGEYAIENGKTSLYDIIKQAGGFTDDAAILSSSVLRMGRKVSEDIELKRLENVRPVEMTVEEASYFRLRTRENRYIVTVDYNKLFNEKDKGSDILLYDEDMVVVPERKMTVFVSGGVLRPGNLPFRPGWIAADYIRAAGGFTDMARESWITLIDSRTGKWNEIEDDDRIKEGDIIFVPERDRIDWYTRFLDGLAIVAQVSAIVLVVVTLAK